MISKIIYDSERFLKMSPSARDLYTYLVLHADDDGIVEAGTVLRLTRGADDDLNLLIFRKLVTVLDAENKVVFINDWLLHNTVRADRKTNSVYKDLLLQVLPDVKLVEKKQRSDRLSKLDYVEESSDTADDEAEEITSDRQSISVIVEQLFEKYNMTKSLKLFRKAFDDELIYRQLQNLMIELKKKTIKIKDITAWLYSACDRDYPLKRSASDNKPVSHKERHNDSEAKKRAERQLKALKDEID